MIHSDRKIFIVVGTGRSGTCWVGDILRQHPEILGHVEPKPLFGWITRVAVHSQDETILLPQIFAEYERLWSLAEPRHLADKSHPAIWIAEKLATRFPNAYFVGVGRNVLSTVASMLQHKGVRRWCEEWKKYPVPNRFLGIELGNRDWYGEAGLVERCAVRWLVHQRELNRLAQSLGSRFVMLRYEELVCDTSRSLQKLREFGGLRQDFATPQPRSDVLAKWKAVLTSLDVERIRGALSYHNWADHDLGGDLGADNDRSVTRAI